MKRTGFTHALLLLLVMFGAGCDRRGVTSKSAGEATADLPAENSPSGVETGPRRRTALVIGNSRYQKLQPLAACKNDAETMAATFRRIGIELHDGKPLLDLTTDQMDSAITGFARSLDRSSEAFVYFTGHGAQIGGTNYLLPVNYDAQYEAQARRQAISLDAILEALEKTESRLRVVILDACRDPGNLLPGEPLTKSSVRSKGLDEQRVDAPETLVCFATKHGTVALADDKASFYSRVLAEEMVKPGTVENVLKAVAKRVYAATEKRQLPFTYGSLLQDHCFVKPQQGASLAEAVLSAPAPVASPAETAPLPAMAEPLEVAKLTPPVPVALKEAVVAVPQPPNESSAILPPASKTAPFVNGLGMEFVPVPITGAPGGEGRVLFCRWETRAKDFQAFAKESRRNWQGPASSRLATHPAVQVSWEDAVAFCVWLTAREQKSGKLPPATRYRLPTDHEWSCAIEIGAKEQAERSPAGKDGGVPGYPWGEAWPPPKGAGNLDPSLALEVFETTSPVGNFGANALGLYDLCGNVWEWCDDWVDPTTQEDRVLRGGSWFDGAEIYLRSSARYYDRPGSRSDFTGFRCVLAGGGS